MKHFIWAIIGFIIGAGIYFLSTYTGWTPGKYTTHDSSSTGSFDLTKFLIMSLIGAVVLGISAPNIKRKKK